MDALLGVSNDGFIVSSSEDVRSLLGYANEELRGVNAKELFGVWRWRTPGVVYMTHKSGHLVQVAVQSIMEEDSVTVLQLRPTQRRKCTLYLQKDYIVRSNGAYGVFGYSDQEILAYRSYDLLERLNEGIYDTSIYHKSGSIVMATIAAQTLEIGTLIFSELLVTPYQAN